MAVAQQGLEKARMNRAFFYAIALAKQLSGA